jgi:arylsulfatase A-like enzyme/cytochrome c-type biogenesis protein CcmH/NrfG
MINFSYSMFVQRFVQRALLCGLSLTSAMAAAATPLPDLHKPPNVILITLDTTRADRMGFLGSKLGLTPNLDGLARQSVIFTRAYSQVPLTTASHATILTGTYPQFHHVNDFGVPLAESLPYAPYIFRGNGYHTAAFVGSLVLDPEARSAPGFERGFDTYDADFHRRRTGEDRYHSIERRGDEVVGRALTWLNAHQQGPFFIWVHLYDAHDPYDPPEPYKTQYASAPYDGEIAYVDAAVGKLLSWLRTNGLYDGALIAVMADHGEALGDHGETTHGIFLYDETIRVPLLFKLPGESSAGTKIDGRAGLVDVLPTILQAVGIAIPTEVQGESLLPLLKAGTVGDRAEYSESDYPHRTFGWSSLRSLRTGKYLFVEAPRKELYDQTIDPKAEHNLSEASAAVSSTLDSQLEAFRVKTSNTKEAPKLAADPSLQEKLNALGYVAADSRSSALPGINDTGIDPKDKVEVVNLLHSAEIAKEEERLAEAEPLFEQVIKLEPDLPISYLQLGTVLSSLQEYGKAVPILRKAVAMRPDLTIPRYQLGGALFETGDYPGAIVELEVAVSRSPQWTDALFLLGATYARSHRFPDAIREYRKIIEVRPNHFGAHLLLGRALALSGDPREAVASLLKAAELQPKSPEPHVFLADAYVQLGQTENAERERTAAQQLKAGNNAQ